MQATERLLTLQEVAEFLKCSRGHVRNLIATGKLRAIDIALGPRHEWRVPENRLEGFMLAHTEAG